MYRKPTKNINNESKGRIATVLSGVRVTFDLKLRKIHIIHPKSSNPTKLTAIILNINNAVANIILHQKFLYNILINAVIETAGAPSNWMLLSTWIVQIRIRTPSPSRRLEASLKRKYFTGGISTS